MEKTQGDSSYKYDKPVFHLKDAMDVNENETATGEKVCVRVVDNLLKGI